MAHSILAIGAFSFSGNRALQNEPGESSSDLNLSFAVANIYLFREVGGGAMASYRAYLIDSEDRIKTVRIVEADTDAQALEAARQYVDGLDVEVWDHERKIGRLSNKPQE